MEPLVRVNFTLAIVLEEDIPEIVWVIVKHDPDPFGIVDLSNDYSIEGLRFSLMVALIDESAWEDWRLARRFPHPFSVFILLRTHNILLADIPIPVNGEHPPGVVWGLTPEEVGIPPTCHMAAVAEVSDVVTSCPWTTLDIAQVPGDIGQPRSWVIE